LLVGWKAQIAAVAAAGLVALALPRLMLNRAVRPFLIFSGYCALRALAQEEPDLAQAAMIMLWALVTFVAVPSLFRTRSSLVVLLSVAVLAALLGSTVALRTNIREGVDILVVSKGGYYGERERLTLGIGNAVYFAKVAGTLAVSALLLHSLAVVRPVRLLLLGIVGMATVLVIRTDTRAMVTFLAIAYALYLSSGTSRVHRVFRFLLIATAAVAGLSAATEWLESANPYTMANGISSGRIDLWRRLLARSLSADAFVHFVVGAGDIDWGPDMWQRSSTHSSGSTIQTSFQFLRADSVYVDVFLRHGIIGLSLLFWSGYRLWRSLRRAAAYAATAKDRVGHCLSAVSGICAGFAAFSVFDSSIPSLGNPFNALALPPAVAVALWAMERAQPHTLVTPGPKPATLPHSNPLMERANG
jgi:hypothetical protein